MLSWYSKLNESDDNLKEIVIQLKKTFKIKEKDDDDEINPEYYIVMIFRNIGKYLNNSNKTTIYDLGFLKLKYNISMFLLNHACYANKSCILKNVHKSTDCQELENKLKQRLIQANIFIFIEVREMKRMCLLYSWHKIPHEIIRLILLLLI